MAPDLSRGKRYDLIVETDDLVNLPYILANKSEKFRAFQSMSLPRLNISANSDFPLLWNQEMKEVFKKSYAADLALLEGFKARNFETNIEIAKLIESSRQKIKLYERGLILARDFLKSLSS